MVAVATHDNTSLVHRDPNTIYLRQSNALTTAAYTLSRNEKRLVYLSLEKIFNGGIEEERGRFDVVIHHVEYSKIFGDTSKNISRDIAKASAALNKREIVFYLPEEDGDDGEKALDGLSWTVKRSIRPKRGTTLLSFNAELVDMLRADGKYTGYFLSNVSKLNNQYSMRLYESLRQWITIKRKQRNTETPDGMNSVTFSIDWLMKRYELPDSYKRMSDFRRRFLIPSIEEITGKTDIELRYEENSAKGGRRNSIVSITFFWREKEEVGEFRDINEPIMDEFNDVLVPPERTDHEDDIYVELGIAYLQNFSDRSVRPNMAWGMEYIVTYQKVKGEEPPEVLKNMILAIVQN